jgi:hypothetical protein
MNSELQATVPGPDLRCYPQAYLPVLLIDARQVDSGDKPDRRRPLWIVLVTVKLHRIDSVLMCGLQRAASVIGK